MTAPERCATHPSRPAVDACPRCGQPRCGVDAQGPGCPLCDAAAEPVAPQRPAPSAAVQVVRALLGAGAVALVAGPICSEYVQAGFLQYVVPLVTGVLCGAAGMALARHRGDGRSGLQLRVLTAAVAVLGVALGFHLEGSVDPLSGGDVVLPYLLAVAGALGWTQPPRRRAV